MDLDREDFELLFDTAPVGLAVLDANLRYVFCNKALAVMNGVPAQAHIGRSMAEIVPEVAKVAQEHFQSVLETGTPIVDLRLSGEVPKGSCRTRHWLENVEAVRRNGAIVAILVSVKEITALEEAQEALRDSQKTLEASQNLNPDGFAILRAERRADGTVMDFIWEYANPAAVRANGSAPLVGQRLLQVAPPGAPLTAAFERYIDTLARQGHSQLEYPYQRERYAGWFRTTVVAIDKERIAVSFTDITSHKRHAEGLGIALDEFRHRLKNLLAVVSSLIGHARRSCDDIDEFTVTIQRQLQALAVAQSVIMGDPTAHVTLADVAKAALRPFPIQGLVIVGGPPVNLDVDLALAFTLVFHEMATNSVKYGALSQEGGEVQIGWTTSCGRVDLRWTESGGPAVVVPTRQGFGSKLLKMLEKRLSDGQIVQEYVPEGLIMSIKFSEVSSSQA